MKKALCGFVLVLALALAWPWPGPDVFGGEAPPPEAAEEPAERIERRGIDLELEEDGEDEEEEHEEAPPVEYLGRTLRLQFRLVPEEGDEQPRWLHLATRRYEQALHAGHEGGRFRVFVEGEVYLIADKEQVLLTYSAGLGWDNDDGDGEFTASGSAVVPLNEKRQLARFGEKTLVVRITPADETPPGQKLAPVIAPEGEVF